LDESYEIPGGGLSVMADSSFLLKLKNFEKD